MFIIMRKKTSNLLEQSQNKLNDLELEVNQLKEMVMRKILQQIKVNRRRYKIKNSILNIS